MTKNYQKWKYFVWSENQLYGRQLTCARKLVCPGGALVSEGTLVMQKLVIGCSCKHLLSAGNYQTSGIGWAGFLNPNDRTRSDPPTGLWPTLAAEINGWLISKLPLKIQILLWMLYHDRLQTAVQLKNRKWDGPKECKLCGVIEDLDHLFFRCPTS